MSKIKVSKYIMDFMEAQGVSHAFCLVGGGCIFLIDALNNSKIKPIFNSNEQCCTIAANAYAQYKNNLGLAIVTTGPGVTNALTGVAAAFIDSVPMIILSGQVNTYQMKGNSKVRQAGIQGIDTESLVKSVVKKVFVCTNADDISSILTEAVHIAKSNRPGPVWIDLPLDIQNTDIENTKTPITVISNTDRSLNNITKLLNKLLSAQKPVIFIGNGVRLSNTVNDLQKIIKILQIPVLTTWRSADLFTEDNPLYIGRPGMIGQRGANFVLQNCDCLLCLGTRLDLAQIAFDYNNFAPKAEKYIVDIDESEIDKIKCNSKHKIVENLTTFIPKFYQQLLNQNIDNLNYSLWLKRCQEWKKNYPVYTENTSNFISLYQFIDTLSPYLENKIIVLGSSGSVAEVIPQAIKIPKNCRIINNPGLGSMGFAIPSAIGAHCASNKPIICIEGDGSLFLNLQELYLIGKNKLPMMIFIINNDGYVSIRNTQNNVCEKRWLGSDSNYGLCLPDNLQKIAYGFNISYTWCADPKSFDSDISKIMKMNLPLVCEVFTDPLHQTICRTMTTKDENGQLRASKLENLWPFLSEQELKENLL